MAAWDRSGRTRCSPPAETRRPELIPATLHPSLLLLRFPGLEDILNIAHRFTDFVRLMLRPDVAIAAVVAVDEGIHNLHELPESSLEVLSLEFLVPRGLFLPLSACICHEFLLGLSPADGVALEREG